MNPEYFPSSYLKPVPTDPVNKDLLKRGFANGLSFPRSTITGTLEDFRILLRCSVFSKSNKIPAETYRALSLNISSEALDVTDKATAPKRISAFLRLCAAFIPCQHGEYDEAVEELNAEVSGDLAEAKLTLENIQDGFVPAIVKSESEAPSVLLQVLYALQLGHVQFLMADYKSRIIEAYPNAFARVLLLRGPRRNPSWSRDPNGCGMLNRISPMRRRMRFGERDPADFWEKLPTSRRVPTHRRSPAVTPSR
jgi:hypothetical protein